MDLHEFNAHCARTDFPLLEYAQWEALMSTSYGSELHSQEANDDVFLPSLELLVRSVSPAARCSLEKLGFPFSLQVVLDIAVKEGKAFFVALHKSSSDLSARQYVSKLLSEKPEKKNVPAPYYSFHVYGAKAALCLSEAQTRTQQRQSINIEGAHILGAGSNQYDWKNKIIIQLSPEEMFLVLALLNGKIDHLQFAGHGLSHDKVFEMQAQQSHYFVKLIQRGRSPVTVPMQSQHALNLTSLLFAQIKKNHPHLGMDEMRVMEEQLVRMHRLKSVG